MAADDRIVIPEHTDSLTAAYRASPDLAPGLVPLRLATTTEGDVVDVSADPMPVDAPDGTPASTPGPVEPVTIRSTETRRQVIAVVLTTVGVLAGTAGAAMVAIPLGLAVFAVCAIAFGIYLGAT